MSKINKRWAIKKEMEKWTNIYGYEDGTIAVYNGQDLMLKHHPNFIGVIDEKHKEELVKWLFEKECKSDFIGAIDEKHKEELFKRLLEKECKSEVRINRPMCFKSFP